MDLWLSVREGNRNAFDAIYHRHVQAIFASIYKMIDSRQDAEDIAQEVFLDLWVKRDRIEIQASLFNYLFSVARYKTIRHLKNKSLLPKSLDLLLEHAAAEDLPLDCVLPGDAGLRQAAAVFNQEVSQLPPQMKKVYSLYTDEQKSVKEIASIMDISPNTVKNHLAKVGRRLRLTVGRLYFLFF